jgi:hypothetical protein
MVKSRMGQFGNVLCMREIRNATGVLGTDGRLLLK